MKTCSQSILAALHALEQGSSHHVALAHPLVREPACAHMRGQVGTCSPTPACAHGHIYTHKIHTYTHKTHTKHTHTHTYTHIHTQYTHTHKHTHTHLTWHRRRIHGTTPLRCIPSRGTGYWCLLSPEKRWTMITISNLTSCRGRAKLPLGQSDQ